MEFLAVHGHAAAQGGELVIGGAAVQADTVFAQPAGCRQFELPLDRAVIGEQQQAFGGDVEPADRQHAGHVLGEGVEHGAAALLVAIGGHEARRLVIEPQARLGGGGEGLAIHRHLVRGGDVEGGAAHGLAVDGDTPGLDPALGFAAAGKARAGDDLGDTVAGGCDGV